MLEFPVLPVSVKSKMTIWIKGESLSFKRWRIYKSALQRPFRNRLSERKAFRHDRWKLKMQVVKADVEKRILALVRSILEQNAIAAELTPESLLVDVGLTSMDMVNLMLGVEAEFDFTIPQSEITPDNFQSVKTLQRMVITQLQLATAA